ncbi:MAG: PSD1 and planctomycete cytochrome C domain-containing protein [Planctomycetota bacterium]|nr:PSD1 and planctomycete cytochrome C domain-containing protein [Planctomycetota bacterium]
MVAPHLRALALAPLFAMGLSGSAGAWWMSSTVGSPDAEAEAPPVDFLRDVRPILAERCLLCHGNDADEGGLRFNSLEAAMVDLGGYAALVPGDAEASELLWRVRAEDESERMPPADHDQPLSPAEVDLLERWVTEGAPWVEHWAFAPLAPSAPPLPAADEPAWAQAWANHIQSAAPADSRGSTDSPPLPGIDPKPSASTGARRANPVDAWVRAGLVDADLTPAPDVDDLTWLRRASFDLIGLPPTPAEQDLFLAEPAGQRRARATDRLLASPHFGERWARHLLDLVRYAESRGHEFDFTIPGAWEYRDYLVRALNRDVGWDMLLTEHVAGDLVEPARLSTEGWNESVLGTGFWHLGESAHAPVDLEIDRADRTANQLDVFGKTFLGLTLACARCHDHKFDPIPTKDYYALAGYVQSASYRQVRFETLPLEEQLRAELDAVEASHGATALRDLRRRSSHASMRATEARGLARELDARVAEARAERRLFDFEPDATGTPPTWAELGWQVEGTAFGAGPMTRATMPGWFVDPACEGTGFVNSHDGRVAADSPASDALVGRALSPAFTLDRERLSFLIGGGSHAGQTEVRLVVDGDVVRSATGRDAGELGPVEWDVTDLLGREARLELLDQHTGGWGHIGCDAVRLEHPVEGPELHALAAELAEGSRADAALVLAWRAHLDATAAAGARVAPEPDPDAALLWLAERDPFWQNGVAFTERPANGAWLTGVVGSGPGMDPASGSPGGTPGPVAAFAPNSPGWRDVPTPLPDGLGAVGLDPAWLGLSRADATEPESTQVDWDGAGRTLRTPTWTLGEGSLWLLVRGRGVAFAPVEGHRTLHGPLHVETRLRFDTEDEWRWVEHGAMAAYTGLRAHVELSPDGADAWVGIAAVAQGSAPPFSEPRGGLDELLAQHPELAPPTKHPTSAERAYAELRTELAAQVPRTSRTAPALLDGSPVDQRVLVRGQSSSPGEVAPRAFLERFRDPGELAPRSTAAGLPTSGRLQLAESMLEHTGPLVARTFANRVWMHLMGRGLVPTPDNLGTLAAFPSHPELLDALSCELVEADWSLKSLVRTIVLSRVYGLSGGAPDSQDPPRSPDAPAATTRALTPRLDALYGRRAPKRLDAEAVRDAVLAASGSLDVTLGGPPVPVFLTEAMSGRGRPAESGPVDGAGRRSLYLAVRRNFLPPFQLVWDFPQPGTTIGRRSSSNVPAQSLALMNDAFVVQEAERWAARLLGAERADADMPNGKASNDNELERKRLAADANTDRGRIELLWRTALGRSPSQAELDGALAFLDSAAALSPEGDANGTSEHRLDTWTDLCHAIFQLKEFVHVP